MELNSVFGTDRGVTFELFNEPAPDRSASNWQIWASGGTLPNQTEPSVGMQTILTDLRNAGSLNVIFVDGLKSARTLLGVPPLTDPLKRLAYAVHPYQFGIRDAEPDATRYRHGVVGRGRQFYWTRSHQRVLHPTRLGELGENAAIYFFVVAAVVGQKEQRG